MKIEGFIQREKIKNVYYSGICAELRYFLLSLYPQFNTNMMKFISRFALAAVVAIMLAACGGNNKSTYQYDNVKKHLYQTNHKFSLEEE